MSRTAPVWPPLVVGSPSARALYGLLSGDPIVRLEPDPGLSPLETMALVIGQLARYRSDRPSMKILLPTGPNHPRLVVDELIDVFEAAGAQAGRSPQDSLMARIPVGRDEWRLITILLVDDKALRREPHSAGLLLACTGFARPTVKAPLGLSARQVLLVGTPEEPCPPVSDYLRDSTRGLGGFSWGPMPAELLLAGGDL